MMFRKSLNLLPVTASRNFRFSSTLVLAEHNNKQLNSLTLNAVTAAKKIGGDITVLVAGTNARKVAEESAKIADVKKVIFAEGPQLQYQLSECVSDVLFNVQNKSNFSHIIATASAFSRSIMPRVAGKLKSSPISDIIEICDEYTFIRPTYAGNANAKVKSNAPVKFLTIRNTAFEPSSFGGNATIEDADVQIHKDFIEFIGQELSKSERPDLGSANIVISGGRGLKSGENFKLLYELADKLGAAVGASRAAVDAGFVPNDMQVGQTGKIVAPLYIAVGISGAIQHLAGMKDSKVIVAINKDKDAPIFQVADFGLEADLFKAVPELTAELSK